VAFPPLGREGRMTVTIRRRELLAAVGGAAAAWPVAAREKQPTLPVIGFLYPGPPETIAKFVTGFRKGLGELGYVEGRNVAIEYRWGYDESGRLPELAADLVSRPVTVIVTPGSAAAALTAKAAQTHCSLTVPRNWPYWRHVMRCRLSMPFASLPKLAG